jgi:hypothetical protein
LQEVARTASAYPMRKNQPIQREQKPEEMPPINATDGSLKFHATGVNILKPQFPTFR